MDEGALIVITKPDEGGSLLCVIFVGSWPKGVGSQMVNSPLKLLKGEGVICNEIKVC